MNSRWLMVLLCSVMGLVGLSSNVEAFQVQATAKQAGNKVARWATLPVTIEIHQDGAPDVKDGSDIRAIRNALDAWTVPGCNNLKFTSSTSTTTSFAGRKTDPTDPLSDWTRDGKSVIRFETKAWEWSKLELARNATYFEPQTGKIQEADLLFNAVHFKWSTDQTVGTIDVETVALARIGFMLGLWFSDVPGALLHSSTDLRSVQRNLARDDIDGSCFLYPTSGWNDAPPPAPGESPQVTEPPPTVQEPTVTPDSGVTPTPDAPTGIQDDSATGGCQCNSNTPPSWPVFLCLVLFAVIVGRRSYTR